MMPSTLATTDFGTEILRDADRLARHSDQTDALIVVYLNAAHRAARQPHELARRGAASSEGCVLPSARFGS